MGDGGHCWVRWSGGPLAGIGDLVLLPGEEKASGGCEEAKGTSSHGEARRRRCGEELEREGLQVAAGACEAGSLELLWRQRRPFPSSHGSLLPPGRLLHSPGRLIVGSTLAQERPLPCPSSLHPPTRIRRLPSLLQRQGQLLSLPNLLPNSLLRPRRPQLPRGLVWQPGSTSPTPLPRNDSSVNPIRQRGSRVRRRYSSVGFFAPGHDARWTQSNAERAVRTLRTTKALLGPLAGKPIARPPPSSSFGSEVSIGSSSVNGRTLGWDAGCCVPGRVETEVGREVRRSTRGGMAEGGFLRWRG